jgi:hypothetical protein
MDDNKVFMFALFNIFYAVFLFFLNVQGLRSASKYSITYYICEIVVTYYAIIWLINKFTHVRYVAYAGILLFFAAGLAMPNALSWNFKHDLPDPVYEEAKALNLDEKCLVAKVHANQPIIDQFTGMQRRVVYFGRIKGFYDNINTFNKSGKCIYFHEKLYENKMDYAVIDFDKVAGQMSGCKKTIVQRFDNADIVRYDCP